MNLIEGLLQELPRNRHLLEQYKKIPAGAFGAVFIAKDIASAEKAMTNGDTVAMMKAFKSLKENQ